MSGTTKKAVMGASIAGAILVAYYALKGKQPVPQISLNNIKIASQYRLITDGMRYLPNTLTLLKETNTQYVNLGFARVTPVPEKCSDLPEEDQVRCNLRGYSFERLRYTILTIKQEMPGILIGGSVSAEFLNPECRNEQTGEIFTKDQTWAMALDPSKWGIPVTKEDFQTSIAVSHGWVEPGVPYNPKDQMPFYFPDQTNQDYQTLYLSWIGRQIDSGIDSILIDINTKQAKALIGITEDVNHPAVSDTFNAIAQIDTKIHQYGASIGRNISVMSWATETDLTSPYPAQPLDGVMATPSTDEIIALQMDEAKWDSYIASIRNKFGNIPIFVMFDQGPDYRPLEAFSQNLSIDQANQFLNIIDNFCKAKGMIFVYPLHGGIMGANPAILSFGSFNWYDSLAPEFSTYDTIRQLATAKG